MKMLNKKSSFSLALMLVFIAPSAVAQEATIIDGNPYVTGSPIDRKPVEPEAPAPVAAVPAVLPKVTKVAKPVPKAPVVAKAKPTPVAKTALKPTVKPAAMAKVKPAASRPSLSIPSMSAPVSVGALVPSLPSISSDSADEEVAPDVVAQTKPEEVITSEAAPLEEVAEVAPMIVVEDEPEMVLSGDFGMEEIEPISHKTNAAVTYDHYVEFSVINVDEQSFKFAEYRALEEDDYAYLSFDLNGGAAYDDKSDSHYWRLLGRDVDSGAMSLEAEYGEQGRYDLSLNYNEIPKYLSDEVVTSFNFADSDTLTLPAIFGTTCGGSCANAGAIVSSYGVGVPFELKYGRERMDVGLKYWLTRELAISGSIKQDTKTGLKDYSAMSQSFNHIVLLPEPIDYVTNELELNLSYMTRNTQAKIGIYQSVFENNNESLTWADPWDPSITARIALPVSNEFTQFTAAIGHNINLTSRVTFDMAYGVGTQDEAFLPPDTFGGTAPPSPNSLDGEIEFQRATAVYLFKPRHDINMTLRHRYDERVNNTPQYSILYTRSDAVSRTDQGPYTNLPFSYAMNHTDVDVAYRLKRGYGKVNAGIDYETVERDYLERDETDETGFWVAYRNQILESTSVRVKYLQSKRSGSTYDSDVPGVEKNHTNFNNEESRRFFEADRDRTRTDVTVNFIPTLQWAVNMTVGLQEDEYVSVDSTKLGMNYDKDDVFNLDVTFMPNNAFAAFVYATNEQFNTATTGRQWGTELDPSLDWSIVENSDVLSVGIGFEWEAIRKRLTIELDANMTDVTTEYRTAAASGLGGGVSAQVPDLTSNIESVTLSLAYHIDDQSTVKLSALTEKFESEDWAEDGVGVDEGNLLSFGGDSPDYEVTAISLSYRYDFNY